MHFTVIITARSLLPCGFFSSWGSRICIRSR